MFTTVERSVVETSGLLASTCVRRDGQGSVVEDWWGRRKRLESARRTLGAMSTRYRFCTWEKKKFARPFVKGHSVNVSAEQLVAMFCFPWVADNTPPSSPKTPPSSFCRN